MNKEEIIFLIRAATREMTMGWNIEDFNKHLKENIFEAKFERFGFGKPTKTRLEIKITKEYMEDQQ